MKITMTTEILKLIYKSSEAKHISMYVNEYLLKKKYSPNNLKI